MGKGRRESLKVFSLIWNSKESLRWHHLAVGFTVFYSWWSSIPRSLMVSSQSHRVDNPDYFRPSPFSFFAAMFCQAPVLCTRWCWYIMRYPFVLVGLQKIPFRPISFWFWPIESRIRFFPSNIFWIYSDHDGQFFLSTYSHCYLYRR